jgi:hypothetical protein
MTSYLKLETVQEKANVRTLVFRNKVHYQNATSLQNSTHGKDPPSDNAIRRWLKQFQETGSEDDLEAPSSAINK